MSSAATTVLLQQRTSLHYSTVSHSDSTVPQHVRVQCWRSRDSQTSINTAVAAPKTCSHTTMIGKTWFDYVRITISIAALRSIAPASIIYLILSLCQGHFLLSPWIGLLTAAEASFFALVYLPRYFRLQKVSRYWTCVLRFTF